MDDTKEEFQTFQENRNTMTVKEEGRKFQQYFCAIIASIGALLIGTILAWTSPSLPFLENRNYSAPITIVNKEQTSWIAAWTPIGAIFGALPAGIIADSLGRKLTLIIFAVPLLASSILISVAPNITMLYLARFISGLVGGLFCAVLPTYVTEISEDSIRGTLGTLFQVFLTLGILFDYGLGSFDSYPILCNVISAINVVFFVLLFFIPESPTYLMKKNRKDEAEQCLRRLRGPRYNIQIELTELRKGLENSTQQSISCDVLCERANALGLTISVGLMMLQQLSGINGVIFFAQKIFADAGSNNPAQNTIIMGIVQTVATIVSSVLVDRAGRKILLLISSAGMCVTLMALGYYFWVKEHGNAADLSWLPLVSLVVFIIAFSLGVGPLPWMMSSEVLSPEVKSFGSGISVAVNWICVSLVTFFFQPLTDLISTAYTFWIFSVVCIIGIVFVLIILPETKGKSMQQIQNELAGKNTCNLNGKV